MLIIRTIKNLLKIERGKKKIIYITRWNYGRRWSIVRNVGIWELFKLFSTSFDRWTFEALGMKINQAHLREWRWPELMWQSAANRGYFNSQVI